MLAAHLDFICNFEMWEKFPLKFNQLVARSYQSVFLCCLLITSHRLFL